MDRICSQSRRHSILRSKRALVGGAILASFLLMGPLLAHPAGAVISVCYDDPILTLSDGTQIQVAAIANDNVADVNQAIYQVTIPAGVTVTNIVDSGGAMAGKEVVTWSNTGPDNTYSVATTVYTGASNVNVGVVMHVASAGWAYTGGISNGQPLVTRIVTS